MSADLGGMGISGPTLSVGAKLWCTNSPAREEGLQGEPTEGEAEAAREEPSLLREGLGTVPLFGYTSRATHTETHSDNTSSHVVLQHP